VIQQQQTGQKEYVKELPAQKDNLFGKGDARRDVRRRYSFI